MSGQDNQASAGEADGGRRDHLTELDALLERIESQEHIASPESTSASNPLLGAAQHHRRMRTHGGGRGHRPGRRHQRTRTSLGDAWGSFSGSLSGSLTTIAEGVYAEAELLRDTLRDELKHADEGSTYFLEMGMTRSLSVVPEAIQEFAAEAVGVAMPMEVAKEDANVVARYMSLLGAVLAISSQGTALSLLDGVTPSLKMFWRMTATALCLSFFAIRTMLSKGLPVMSTLQWFTFAGAVLGFSIQMTFYYHALEYTSIGNAVIGSNSQAILLVVGRVILGQRVLRMEGGGVMLAFAGAVLCSLEESRHGNDYDGDGSSSSRTHLLGDLLALSAGFAGLGYLTFAKAVRPHMPVTVFMFLVMVLGALLVLGFILATDSKASWSLDPHHGLFGWMTLVHDRLYVLMYIAIICNVMGTMGFVRAMQYFDSIIIAVATLLEPTAATIIAYAVGIGAWPTMMGWAGNALVVVGTLTVVYPSVNQGFDH
jgi:drug/metabolite transporter (DMT)-like permease